MTMYELFLVFVSFSLGFAVRSAFRSIAVGAAVFIILFFFVSVMWVKP